MMRSFSVSRGTVIRALRDLEMQGILRRQRGLGTFVESPKADDIDAAPVAPLAIALFMAWSEADRHSGSFHMQLHHAINRVCGENHATVLLQTISAKHGANRREQVLGAAQELIDRKQQVVLYCGLELPHDEMGLNEEAVDLLESAGIRVAVIDRDVVPYPRRSRFPWISYDNQRGGAILTEHMLQKGCKRLAFLSINQDSTAVFERLSGYYDALRFHGLSQDNAIVMQYEDAPSDALCDELLSRGVDGIICKDAASTVRMSMLLERRGKAIGREIALAGFDDEPMTTMVSVPLTVVRQPVKPFASAVFEVASMLADSEGGPTGVVAPQTRIVVPVELVVRESTRMG